MIQYTCCPNYNTTEMTKKKPEHYVNNRDFLHAIIEYKNSIKEAEILGKPKPRVTDYIGSCFMKIAIRYSYKPNFINYPFKDDMISDACENATQYMHNFNPEKSTNPFAYFTQITHNAFIRRITKEKRQLEIKNRLIEMSGYDEVMTIDDKCLTPGGTSDYNAIKDKIQYKSNN